LTRLRRSIRNICKNRCLIRRTRIRSLATIWRDLPGFTGGGTACASNKRERRQGRMKIRFPAGTENRQSDAEGKTMTILQATKSKASSAVSRTGRLFLLELSGDRNSLDESGRL
jgi:hypothetical protein